MFEEIAVCVALFAVVIYVWLTWHYNHWKKLKIPSLEPSLIYGNLKDFVLMKKCKGAVYDELYWKRSEPAIGIYYLRQPQWLIRDPGFVKIISTNEFSNFRENDVYTEPSDFFLSTNIFFFSGEKWKKSRSIITPALSPAKLKLFIPHMVDVAREMFMYLDENGGKPLEARSFSGLFTIETAMSYVYGVKVGSYKDPNSKYRQAFNEVFDPTFWNGFKFAIANLWPSVGHFFKIGFTPRSFTNFYVGVVKEAVEYKKKNNSTRKDFLQYLMDTSGKDGSPELSIHDMAGLTMNLAADATETTSFGLHLVMDAILRYPQCYEKLKQEIDDKINSLDDITYDNINSLPYLTAFIFESFRIIAPVPLLEVKCTNSCEITYNNIKYKFAAGDKVAFSIFSMQRDPKYFPEPEQFQPERFLNDSDHPGFSPFGSGPRMCLGRSFAALQMKVFICALLRFYDIAPKDSIAPPLEFEANSQFFMMIKGGVWFKAKRRSLPSNN